MSIVYRGKAEPLLYYDDYDDHEDDDELVLIGINPVTLEALRRHAETDRRIAEERDSWPTDGNGREYWLEEIDL